MPKAMTAHEREIHDTNEALWHRTVKMLQRIEDYYEHEEERPTQAEMLQASCTLIAGLYASYAGGGD